MTRLSRIAKHLVVPVLLAGALFVAQSVIALPPMASFDAPLTDSNPGLGCKTFTFTDTSTDPDNDADGGLVEWDFDNNGSFEETGSPKPHTFATAGTFSVTMQKSDADTAGDGVETDTETKSISVTTATPTAFISPSPNPALPNQTVNFSSAGSSDSDGAIIKHEWDLDGVAGFELDTGVTATTSRAYTTSGTRTVRLRTTDNCGVQSVVDSETLFVTDGNPDASFTVLPSPALLNQTVTFDASASSDLGGSIAQFEWDLDDDGAFNEGGATGEANAAVVTRAYDSSGTRVIALRVTDNSGKTDTLTKPLRINAAPEANFSFDPDPPAIGDPVTFRPTGSRDTDGTITLYEWDLDGNGTYETTGPAPLAHVYSEGDPVTVKLRVTDNNGVKTEAERVVDVQKTQPNANLTFTPAAPVPGQTVRLISTSTPSATPGLPKLESTQWDFDYNQLTGFTAQGAGGSALTSFATPGPKTVAVRVTETGGGTAIASKLIVVNAPPRAGFDATPDDPVVGTRVTFSSTSFDPDGPLAKQEWDLDGDNQFDDATGAVVSTTKLKKGSHPIRLRVTDTRGATAITAQTVEVKAKPLKRQLDPRKLLYYVPQPWGVKFEMLLVKGVPRNATVAVSCKGRGCPRGTFRKRAKKNASRLRFTQVHGSLRAGAKVIVVTTRSGHVGQYVTYIMRGKKQAPVARERCFWSSPKKLRACPS